MDCPRNDRVTLSPFFARRVFNKSVTGLEAPVISKALGRKRDLGFGPTGPSPESRRFDRIPSAIANGPTVSLRGNSSSASGRGGLGHANDLARIVASISVGLGRPGLRARGMGDRNHGWPGRNRLRDGHSMGPRRLSGLLPGARFWLRLGAAVFFVFFAFLIVVWFVVAITYPFPPPLTIASVPVLTYVLLRVAQGPANRDPFERLSRPPAFPPRGQSIVFGAASFDVRRREAAVPPGQSLLTGRQHPLWDRWIDG